MNDGFILDQHLGKGTDTGLLQPVNSYGVPW